MKRQCRACATPFLPTAYQCRKGDYECPRCQRARQNAANAARDLASYARARNARPEVKASLRAYYTRKKSDPVHRLKRVARRKVATEIEAGRLERQPCSECAAAKADAHHHDYTRPLDIAWLCRRCHARGHRADSIAV